MDDEYQEHGLRPGRYAVLTVGDTGVGMDASTRARIFEAFFTTKGPEHGTGLGLATVYGIVKQSGGDIRVRSEPGQGATFEIYLPIAAEEEAAVRMPEATAAPPPVKEARTVLLVDDEPAVRRLTGRLLARAGFTVLEAADPESAYEVASRHAGPIAVLLTDVVLPGGVGADLHERLLAARPTLKVLLMSGHAKETVARAIRPPPQVAFLEKPFTADALIAKIREVIGTPGA